MNVRDSEVICGLLRNMNYELTTNPAEADVVVFNTCSVRKHAEDKVWSELGKFKDKQRIMGIVGCMAEAYKEKIFERAPYVDFVVGPNDIHKIPEIINSFKFPRSPLTEKKIFETEGVIRPEEIYHTGFYENKNHAYVVISEGCSHYCSYCIVPYVRGSLRNRPYKLILREIEEAVAQGITNITLLGQNVNAYQDDGVDFVRLVEEVNSVKGLEEFSFITSHPKDTSLDLFRAIADCEKLKKYLHLPVQSGSDRILKLMRRGYNLSFYLDLVNNYRKIVKGGILTTDIIVGFPTEKEEDFQRTYNLVKEVAFEASYVFKYSPRAYTEAEKFPDDVPREEKERRHRLILELQKGISKDKKR